MEWLANEGLSAFVGLFVLATAIFVLSYSWIRGVLFLSCTALVMASFGRGGDYIGRIQLLLIIAVMLCLAYRVVAIRLYLLIQPAATTFAWLTALTSAWIWIQRGADHKALVVLCSIAILAISIFASRVGDAEDYVQAPASDIPIKVLLDQDNTFLEGLYRAASGRRHVTISIGMLSSYVELSPEDAMNAAERLTERNQVEWIEDSYGFELTRAGTEAVERLHNGRRGRAHVSNSFHFSGNASGVFGSHNNVGGNSFSATGLNEDQLQMLLAQAHELKTRVAPTQAQDIAEAEQDIREAGADHDRLRRGTRRLAYIASSVGEVGAPLLKAANEIIAVLHG